MNNKTTSILALTAMLAAGALRADETNKPASPFHDDKEKVSYAIGLSMGGSWKRQELDVDFDGLLGGLKAGMGIGEAKLTEAETRETLNNFQKDMRTKQQEKQRAAADKNKKDGEDFLAANKEKPGVVTLPSGLQYKILTEGTGEIPKADDSVTASYRGTLIDGTEFDASRPGSPIEFPVKGVIAGWTEALQKMKAGSKWQLFIPSELAYRDHGAPPKIGPNAALIFEVELVSFKSPEPPKPAAPLTSDIIKVPSLEEMKKGAKIETIKAEDLERIQKEAQQNQEKK